MIYATITGRLGRDAEPVKGQAEGLNFTIASDQGWGEKKRTNWVRCSLWGKRAESMRQRLVKGAKVLVVGQLEVREHEGKTYLDLRCNEIELLGDRKEAPETTTRQETSHAWSDADPF